MLIRTSTTIDNGGGITFSVWVNPSLPGYDKQFLAHLAWVLNAYLPASTVLKLLVKTRRVPHTIPLPQNLSPGRWENLMALR